MHTTIYSISESPKDKNVIWVGTDDGNLQVSRDGAKSWNNVVGNVPGLPPNSWVSWVQASNYDAGTAYVAFDRHTFGDMAPYAFRTTDFGKTWTPLVTAQDAKGVRGYAHVIKEDVVKPSLLFLGTEFGLYVSIDGGKGWAQFKGGRFPAVAVRDLAIQPRENDLVLATHGAGSGLSMILRRGARSPLSFFRRRQPLFRRDQCSSALKAVVAGPTATPYLLAIIRRRRCHYYYQKARHLFGKLKLGSARFFRPSS
jgi:hypothetical protein